jgi:hypothetical protein
MLLLSRVGYRSRSPGMFDTDSPGRTSRAGQRKYPVMHVASARFRDFPGPAGGRSARA